MVEGELISNVVNGWNFGDAHFHSKQLLDAVQERCGFEPGDVRVIFLESEPSAGSPARGFQHYEIYDAATGAVERGRVPVAEMISRQPWLDESYDFPVEVEKRAGGGERTPAAVA